MVSFRSYVRLPDGLLAAAAGESGLRPRGMAWIGARGAAPPDLAKMMSEQWVRDENKIKEQRGTEQELVRPQTGVAEIKKPSA